MDISASSEDAPNPFDERQQGVIEDAHFIDPYRAELRQLFDVLGIDDQWSDDPHELAERTAQMWIGSEHGQTNEPVDESKLDAAKPILAKMGLVDAIALPQGIELHAAIMIGGKDVANQRRTQVIADALQSGTKIGTTILWGGARPREPGDASLEELLSNTVRFPGYDVMGDAWVRRAVEEGRFDPTNPWSFTETASAYLMAVRAFGRLALLSADFDTDADGALSTDSSQPGVPPRIVRNLTFAVGELEEGQVDTRPRIVLMNNAAVDRGEGRPARHTTRSSAIEWLRDFSPPQDAVVAAVSSQPHLLRTVQDIREVLDEMGRGDVQLLAAGPGLSERATLTLILGEVARLIGNDARRNHPVA